MTRFNKVAHRKAMAFPTTVIPAFAGIQKDCFGHPSPEATILDSSFRWNDEMGLFVLGQRWYFSSEILPPTDVGVRMTAVRGD